MWHVHELISKQIITKLLFLSKFKEFPPLQFTARPHAYAWINIPSLCHNKLVPFCYVVITN